MRNLLDHSFLRWLRHGRGWENLNNYPNPDPWPWPSAPSSPITTLKLENTLEKSRIRFDGILEISCDEVFLELLDNRNGNESALKSVDVYYRYGNMFLNGTLTHPLNFWDVQMAFRGYGKTEFVYTKNFDLWGANYGHKGVAMATHYKGYGDHYGRLEDEVTRLLGLDEEWRCSKEDIMIMQ
ncbi:hypothetical protein N0V94_000913 [Neodidymelliopsis sp. IMI 364377]|nr:hypothetical protein N0V94_000913 [Neodidymelliopsis sp. IMI 364377]